MLIEGDFPNHRGIPTDIHPIHKISGVEIALTKLHGDGYRVSGGLHRGDKAAIGQEPGTASANR
jgi:DNA gyrase/topoisomerase IV subunit B